LTLEAAPLEEGEGPLAPFLLGDGAAVEELLPLLGGCQEEKFASTHAISLVPPKLWHELWSIPSQTFGFLKLILDSSVFPGHGRRASLEYLKTHTHTKEVHTIHMVMC
jgi:hypothetical protein